jgi:hypothetical protein
VFLRVFHPRTLLSKVWRLTEDRKALEYVCPPLDEVGKKTLVSNAFAPCHFGNESADGTTVAGWYAGEKIAEKMLTFHDRFKTIIEQYPDVRIAQGRIFNFDFDKVGTECLSVLRDTLKDSGGIASLDGFGRPIFNGSGEYSIRQSREGNPGMGFPQIVTATSGEISVVCWPLTAMVEAGCWGGDAWCAVLQFPNKLPDTQTPSGRVFNVCRGWSTYVSGLS